MDLGLDIRETPDTEGSTPPQISASLWTINPTGEAGLMMAAGHYYPREDVRVLIDAFIYAVIEEDVAKAFATFNTNFTTEKVLDRIAEARNATP
jgi:hypothetical protein